MEDQGRGQEDRDRPTGGAGELPPRREGVRRTPVAETKTELPGARSALKQRGLARWLSSHARELTIAGFVLLFSVGITGGYLFFRTDVFSGWKGENASEETAGEAAGAVDLAAIKVYYPFGGGLNMEVRSIVRHDSTTRMAEAVVLEFLKGPARADSYVPEETELLGVYMGSDGILYLDLSQDFRSNFQGDALSEFLLLRGLYESVMSNVSGIKGLKVLIDGKEVESVGGHISLPGTLGEAVSHIMLERNGR